MVRIRDNFPNVYVKVKHFCPLSDHLANVKQEAVTIVSHYSMPGHTGDGHAVVCIYISTYLPVDTSTITPVLCLSWYRPVPAPDTGPWHRATCCVNTGTGVCTLHTLHTLQHCILTCPLLTMLIVELSSFHNHTFFHPLVHHI